MRIVTSAPSKIILCGEHFVVYGAPAIALPVNCRNRVFLTSSNDEPSITIKSNIGMGVYVKKEKKYEGDEALKVFTPVIDYAFGNFDLREKIEIEIFHSGAPKGMGSSSSIGIAVGLSIFSYLGRNPTEEDLFNFGQITDEVAHGGKPSGIDARTISRGKPQKFKKNFNPQSFEFEDIDLELPKGTSLIVATTGNEAEKTGDLIKRFADGYEIKKNPGELTYFERQALLSNYMKVYEKFLKECKISGDPKVLGEAFNENNDLLFPVSTQEIEKVREIALENGAYGAKITGAGGKGGAVIILVSEKDEKKIIESLNEEGYSAFRAEIAKEGPKVEMVSRL